MDYINTKTFEVTRDRNIKDKTDWIPYKWIDESGDIKTLTIPDCAIKYLKYSNDTIKQMTKTEKTNEDARLDSIVNSAICPLCGK